MFRAPRRLALTCFLLALFAPALSSAQTGLATLTGLVTDNTGAAVPGVVVTATNQATNVAYTGVDERGRQLRDHERADRRIRRAGRADRLQGRQSKVTLSAAQTARVDFKLEVGAVEETRRGRRDRRRAADRERGGRRARLRARAG